MSKRRSRELMNELLSFYTELMVPFMEVNRDIPFPGQPGREETDTEHVFSLAIMAIYLNESMKLKLNSDLLIKFALSHDLVEAFAGDVSARAQNEKVIQLKKRREHQAFLKIKRRFGKQSPWLVGLIEEYEKRESDEAKFIYALDKCMGALVRMAGNGAKWSEAYPEPDGSGYHRVVKLLRQKAAAYPDMLELFDAFHEELDKRRLTYS